MRSKYFYWFLLFVFSPQLVIAQSITLDEYLTQVRTKHPFFRKEALSVDISRKEQERFLGDQDWIVKSGPHYLHDESTRGSGFIPEQIDQVSIDAAIERQFWKTGGQLSFSYDYTYSDQEAEDILIPFSGGSATIPGDEGKFHENALTITYSHPLLQNKGGILSRLNYELQGFSVTATDLITIENQEDFLLDVGDRFLDWVLLTEQRRILENRLELAREEFERTERKRKQNLVDEVDVIRAKDAVLNARQNVLGTEASWKAKHEELVTIAQYKTTGDLTPTFDIYSPIQLPPVNEAIGLLKNKSRVLDVFKVRIEQLDHQKTGFIETSKPQLNLNLAGGLKSGDEQYDESYEYDKPQFFASINFSYPLGNRTARADILRTQLEKERVQEDMKNVTIELESILRNLMTQIKELEKVLNLNKEQIEVAKEKTEAELKRYKQGRIELTFVIQSRDNEQNIRLIYAQNGVLYHKLVLHYRALMDTLLEPDF